MQPALFANLAGLNRGREILIIRRRMQELWGQEAFMQEYGGNIDELTGYALASVIIDSMWKWMSEDPARRFITIRADMCWLPYHEKVEWFQQAYQSFLYTTKMKYFDAVRSACRPSPDEYLTSEGMAVVCYCKHMEQKTGSGGLPSFEDLMNIVAHMAHLIPKVYVRDMGKPPSVEQILTVLGEGSILQFLSATVTNNREISMDIFGKLSMSVDCDLDDPHWRLDPQHWVIEGGGSTPKLTLRTETARTLCAHWRSHAEASVGALGCPALYTGRFKDMYLWAVEAFKRWITYAPST